MKWHLFVLILMLALLQPIHAFSRSSDNKPHDVIIKGARLLPPNSTTTHSMDLPDRTLQFTATAGSIRLLDPDDGKPRVDIAYVAYRRTDQDARARPVAFVFNGGPGYASAWLHLGGLGPWRLSMDGAATHPSASPELHDNEDTWLDFTDLVFIDPPGTGYGRITGDSVVRAELWSVDGDVKALAEIIQRWCEANDRLESPKFLVGESYGGFRAPQVARKLQIDQGIGISGLVLISPILTFETFWNTTSVMGLVGSLPTMAAVARERARPVKRADMIDVENYAVNAFLGDLLKGVNDKEAVARLSDKVADLIGLELSEVKKLGGRVPKGAFIRELRRSEGSVSSNYDGSATGFDPDPFSPHDTSDDQIINGLHAPVSESMINLYRQRLKWIVEDFRYLFVNTKALNDWDYGLRTPEAITELSQDMALDPSMRVLVAAGLYDLAIPYYGSKLALDQTPLAGPGGRLQFRVYPAGHMIYIREAARKSLREDVQTLIEGKSTK